MLEGLHLHFGRLLLNPSYFPGVKSKMTVYQLIDAPFNFGSLRLCRGVVEKAWMLRQLKNSANSVNN
jgi:hypothetical protein